MNMNENRLLQVLLSPIISEKSSLVNAGNQYVFQVATDASKPEIKAAVEKMFKVNVESVRIVNLKPKKVRFGRREGVRKAWKKAYVKVAAGNEIDFTGLQA